MEPGIVRVRPRRAGDGAALAEALREVHLKDGYPSLWPDDPEDWLSPPGLAQAWVAEQTEQTEETGPAGLLGHVGVVTGVRDPAVPDPDGTGLASVTRLFVAPAARGRGLGLGGRLLAAVTQWAGEQGHGLMLDVVEDGGSAIALYERLGWRLVDRRAADWETPDGRRLPLRIYLAPRVGEKRHDHEPD
jgi:GNAT superfamily N-acetyltransferase